MRQWQRRVTSSAGGSYLCLRPLQGAGRGIGARASAFAAARRILDGWTPRSTPSHISTSILRSGIGTTIIGALFKRHLDGQLEVQKALLLRRTKTHLRQAETLLRRCAGHVRIRWKNVGVTCRVRCATIVT